MPIIGVIDSSKSGNLYAASFESIATVTISSPTSPITFSSIPATYTHLQLRGIGRGTVAQTEMQIAYQFNGDSGTNYAFHGLRGNGTSVFSFSGAPEPSASGQARLSASSASSGIFGAFVTDILDYANTNKFKTIRTLSGVDTNGAGQVYLTSGLWRSTSAISSLTIGINDGGNFAQFTQVALYGIKVA